MRGLVCTSLDTPTHNTPTAAMVPNRVVPSPPGNATSLSIYYYYSTTLGKYSQEELVARQAVQTLLGLFMEQPMYLNFSQYLTYNETDNTLYREVC